VGAKAAQYLAPGLAQAHPVSLILDVLSRKVLKQGTVHPRLSANCVVIGFDDCIRVRRKLGRVLTTRTLRDRDVEEEPTGMYLWRVLVVNTRPSAPQR